MSTAAPAESEALGRRLTWRDAVSSVLGLGLGGVLIVYGMPLVLDTSWAEIGAQLARVRPGSAALMALLLVAGLFCYTWVLMGSLPGLTHLQVLLGVALGNLANAVAAQAAAAE